MTTLNTIYWTMLAILSIVYLAVLPLNLFQVALTIGAVLTLKHFFTLLINDMKKDMEEADNRLNNIIND